MAKARKLGKQGKKSGNKLKALMRTQQINDFLSKSITESEALQNSGDDRPVYESHVTDLLDNKRAIAISSATRHPAGKRKPVKAKAKPKRRG